MGGGEVLPGCWPQAMASVGDGKSKGEGRMENKERFQTLLGLWPSHPLKARCWGDKEIDWGEGRDSAWAPEEAAMTSKGHF